MQNKIDKYFSRKLQKLLKMKNIIKCGSEDDNDPINPYVKDCKVNVEYVPLEILRQSALLYGHRIEGNYIYGVKQVSEEYKHMFASDSDPPYEVGKTYYYEDSDEWAKFHTFCRPHKIGIHGAGLWASPCFPNHIQIYPNNTLHIPILVRFPLQTTLVMGKNSIKGKIMEIVSFDTKDVEQYIKKD